MDDLISRQMLLEYIHGEPVGRLLCDKYNLDGLIEQLPSAEPKRGKWIEDKGQQRLMQNFIEKGEEWRVCSVCGAGHMIGHKYECDKAYHETYHNFCPKCGAKMEEKT